MMATTEGRLSECEVKFSRGAAACVIMASAGYPESYKSGFEIKIDPSVLEDAKEEPEMLEDLLVAAVNQAIETVEKTNADEMGKLTAGLNLPNIPGF
jgi:DNA-binding protein YbaB